ncbi:hypothetical protein QUA40_24600 [Microcoleus sp. Pol11C3]
MSDLSLTHGDGFCLCRRDFNRRGCVTAISIAGAVSPQFPTALAKKYDRP